MILDHIRNILLAWLVMITGVAVTSLVARFFGTRETYSTIFAIGLSVAIVAGCAALFKLHFRSKGRKRS